jgi:hypothetical protein
MAVSAGNGVRSSGRSDTASGTLAGVRGDEWPVGLCGRYPPRAYNLRARALQLARSPAVERRFGAMPASVPVALHSFREAHREERPLREGVRRTTLVASVAVG